MLRARTSSTSNMATIIAMFMEALSDRVAEPGIG
jgi:hypothetical protein